MSLVRGQNCSSSWRSENSRHDSQSDPAGRIDYASSLIMDWFN